jgi:hypothetical protein
MDNINNLSKTFGPIKEVDAYFKVTSKATYYPTFTRIYIPDSPYDKLIPFMEPVKKIKTINGRPYKASEEDLVRSIRRTKKHITDYVLCNQFELFITLTFDELKIDRYDIDSCKTSVSGWLKNQQKRKGKFEYIVVPELHKDGALHFHALFSNYKGYIKNSVSPYSGKQIMKKGRKVYEIPSYRLGNTYVEKIEGTEEDHIKTKLYLAKYIKKGMPLFHGKKRFWASNGLILPLAEDNPGSWYEKFKPIREYRSDFGVTYDYPIVLKDLEKDGQAKVT